MRRSFQLVCALVAAISLNFAVSSYGATTASWPEQMLKRLNQIRVQNSALPLTICKPLMNSSQSFANSMAKLNFFSHTGKDGSSVGDRVIKAGYDWKNSNTAAGVGENIAAGQSSVDMVMKSWKNSTGHFKNMVNPKFTHVGFGQARNAKSKYQIYWVQNFGYGATC